MKNLTLPLALALGAAPLVFTASDARACGGGFFADATEVETSSASAHRVVLSISPKQTVMWDQIKYEGDPSQFAWVYPVKPGAVLEVGNDAWIEALDAATTPVVSPPDLICPDTHSGCGCGAAGDGNGGDGTPDVTVTHSGTVGPYETVTLHTTTPGALNTWLTQKGFAIPPVIQPVLDDYVTQGFDFIAVRLQPDMGIDAMRPLRVVTQGALTTFPLRMILAGTKDKMQMSLFIISEGRLDVAGFPRAVIDPKKLSWDFGAESSNYDKLRTAALNAQPGTWLTTYAQKGEMFSTDIELAVTLGDGDSPANIFDLYVKQGAIEGNACDPTAAESFGAGNYEVAKECGASMMDGGVPDGGGTGGGGTGGAGGGMSCGVNADGTLDATALVCGGLDDAATALVGMHLEDVWVTRLEAELTPAALMQDLTVVPSMDGPVSNVLTAKGFTNPPCEGGTVAMGPQMPNGAAPMAAFAVAMASVMGRRRRKARG